jgi:hypothetical protein
MVCAVVPLLLKRNFGVFLESSEVLTVMPPFFASYDSVSLPCPVASVMLCLKKQRHIPEGGILHVIVGPKHVISSLLKMVN